MMKLLLTTIVVFGIACLGANAQSNQCKCRQGDILPDAARSRACDGLAELQVEEFPAGTIRCSRVIICNTESDSDELPGSGDSDGTSGLGDLEESSESNSEVGGFSCCNRLIGNQNQIRDRPVNSLGGTGSFPCEKSRPCTYAMYSPGTGGVPGRTPYNTNLACRGRIECGPGRYIYYLMYNHDISSDTTESGECKDFLDLKFVSYGRTTQTCGNYDDFVRKVPFFEGIEETAIETHFHSNSVDGDSTGFYLYTVCFEPTSEPPTLRPGDENDCFIPMPSDITNPVKRNTDEYVEDIFEKIMERDSREKRSGVRFRSPKIKVPDGAKLSYENGVIRVSIGDKWLYKFEGIRVLQTFNMIEGYLTHYGSADGTFLGCGYLRVGDQIAHFIQMPVDFALFPTREETAIIVTYLNALYPSILINSNSTGDGRIFPVEPVFFPGVPPLSGFPGFNGLPGFPPRPPTTLPPSPSPSPSPGLPPGLPGPTQPQDPQEFLDELALANLVRACNPVVRQVACDYLRDRKIRIPDPFCNT